jgi:hypothetical protein
MSVLRYRRSSDGAWTLLSLPAGPTGPQGAKGPTGDMGAKGATGDAGAKGPQGDMGPKGQTGDQGPKGPQGDRGPTGGQGPVGYDGNPTSGGYGTPRWRIIWGATYVTCPANSYTTWSAGFGFSYQSVSAICTGVKNNWGNSMDGAGITEVNANGLVGVVHNRSGSADDCRVAWIAWGTY